jgi:DHA1 family multidrug resistance protein-like MFS transporter
MLRVIKQNSLGLKDPLYASLTLSFASFGDAFLYPFLPQYAEIMQIPVVWIGVLLSINRLIRIVFNPFVPELFKRYGIRPTMITASIIAIVSTIGYGLGLGLLTLIVFRIAWGMAFAVLRISTLAYAFEHENIGFSLGISRSIQEAGPMFALWTGPMLLNYFSIEMTFLYLSVLSLPALLCALQLPELNYKATTRRIINFGLPSLFNSLTFLVSFIIEGMLIIVLGLFLAKNNEQLTSLMITSLAAGYLVYRRLCSILFSPISGAIADRIGFAEVFNGSVLLIIAGLTLLLMGLEMPGLIIIFTFNSVNSTMAPGGASDKQGDKIRAVATNASWRDIGAATGTLTGGLFLSGSLLPEFFIIATFMLVAVLVLNYTKLKKK